jgi:hypothetical protein
MNNSSNKEFIEVTIEEFRMMIEDVSSELDILWLDRLQTGKQMLRCMQTQDEMQT